MKKKQFMLLGLSIFIVGCSSSSLSKFNSYTKDTDDFKFIQGNNYYKPSEYSLNY